MKQLIQNLRTGETTLMEVPTPQVKPGHLLIQTRRSLVSLGTERMLVEFGKAGLLAKIRQQPDKVKQIIDKVQSDGIRPTLEAVIRKVNQPIPLGYCNVGTVLAIGDGVSDFCIGDRVASNGYHAEVVCVPRNLVAHVPDEVSDNEAAFTVVGAVGLNGIRLLAPATGETVVVIGLGLIGLLTAELLRLSGCRIIGVEINEAKCQLAARSGITVVNPSLGVDPVKAVRSMTSGVGADGVIIAAASQTDKLLAQAARLSRKKGTIVLVGVTDLVINRDDLYEKEISLRVACSYGPGRYDDAYEQKGQDYPIAYTRWTANRNFQAILHFLATGQLQVTRFITETVPLAHYQAIYNDLQSPGRIAALLTYPEQIELMPMLRLREPIYKPSRGIIGIIGAGNFTRAILLPALKATGGIVKTIASAGGLNATMLARQFGIAQSTTDYQQLIKDQDIDVCVIATRHDSHARLVIDALKAGKHVFVEKPLAIYAYELPELIEHQQQSGKIVLVGFNRRYSPYVQKMKKLLGGARSVNLPMNIVVTVNAGFVPATSWVHDRAVGGGRILGEACHFVDLITFLTGSRVRQVCLNTMGIQPSETTDSASLLLHYENGATGTINYFSNGSKAYAKERVEVYWQERTLVLDNFRTLTGYGFKGFSKLTGRQDKGHTEQMNRLMSRIRAGTTDEQIEPAQDLITFDEIVNTTQTLFAALQSLRERRFVSVAGIGTTLNKLVSTDEHA